MLPAADGAVQISQTKSSDDGLIKTFSEVVSRMPSILCKHLKNRRYLGDAGAEILRLEVTNRRVAIPTSRDDSVYYFFTTFGPLVPVIAHASGEWIASDWPVCRLADIATPPLLG